MSWYKKRGQQSLKLPTPDDRLLTPDSLTPPTNFFSTPQLSPKEFNLIDSERPLVAVGEESPTAGKLK